jgi:hypothetical protein
MILVVHPESESFIFLPIPRIQGSKRHRIPQQWSLVRMAKGVPHLESLSPPPPRPPNSELGFAPQNCFKGQTVQDHRIFM